MLARTRVVPLAAVITAIFIASFAGTVSTAAADGCGNGMSPDRTLEGNRGGWALEIDAVHGCRGGVKAQVIAGRTVPADAVPDASAQHPLGPTGIFTIPIFCRRDDYMFLPREALGGLPCASVPSQERFDPHALAVRLAAELPPPDLRIGMNPAKGMVNVPTWFWVEGYDGGTLLASQTVVEEHENCHFVAERDANGMPILDVDGRPLTRRECSVESTTFVVDVSLSPNLYAWDFGDKHGRDIACPGPYCGDALGLPFVDTSHASPIQHPYRWSSLGVNGLQDAYTIKLGIRFGAAYRVTVGGSTGGWQGLDERVLSWRTDHKVQEAQAVLTRP